MIGLGKRKDRRDESPVRQISRENRSDYLLYANGRCDMPSAGGFFDNFEIGFEKTKGGIAKLDLTDEHCIRTEYVYV